MLLYYKLALSRGTDTKVWARVGVHAEADAGVGVGVGVAHNWRPLKSLLAV